MVADYFKPPPSKEYTEARHIINQVLDMMSADDLITYAEHIKEVATKALFDSEGLTR